MRLKRLALAFHIASFIVSSSSVVEVVCVEDALFTGESCECLPTFTISGSSCICKPGEVRVTHNLYPECKRCPGQTYELNGTCVSCPQGIPALPDGTGCSCSPDVFFNKNTGECECLSSLSTPAQELQIIRIHGGEGEGEIITLELDDVLRAFNATTGMAYRVDVLAETGNGQELLASVGRKNGTLALEDDVIQFHIMNEETRILVVITDKCGVSYQAIAFLTSISISANVATETVLAGDTLGITWEVDTAQASVAIDLFATSSSSSSTRRALIAKGLSSRDFNWEVPLHFGGQNVSFFARVFVQATGGNGDAENVLVASQETLVPMLKHAILVKPAAFFSIGEWGPCSASEDSPCSTSGTQHRSVTCHIATESAKEHFDQSDSLLCHLLGLEVPASRRVCFPNYCRQWVFSEWSSCESGQCSNVSTQDPMQVREAECMLGESVLEDVTSCNGVLRSSLRLQAPCRNGCYPSVEVDQVENGGCTSLVRRCMDRYTGRLLPLNSPGCLVVDDTSSPRLEPSCDKKNYTEWSPCSAPCGGSGSTERHLLDSSGTIIDTESRTCNTFPCEPQMLLFGTGDKVVCVDKNLNPTSDCKVDTQQALDTCGSLCSSRETPSRSLADATPTQNDVEGLDLLTTCVSGLVSPDGSCCVQGEGLDKDGACCPLEKIDACGVCGGTGRFVDLTGNCCEALDAFGYCCDASDSLGVCGGTRLAEGTSATCGNGLCESGEACSGGTASSDCCISDCPFQIRSCPLDPETGEPCGRMGKCLPSTGQCDCWKGSGRIPNAFEGVPSTCSLETSSCAQGYTLTSKGCVLDNVVVSALCSNGRKDDGEQGLDCGGFCSNFCSVSPGGQTETTTKAPTLKEEEDQTWSLEFLLLYIVAPAVGGLLVIASCTALYCFREKLPKCSCSLCCCKCRRNHGKKKLGKKKSTKKAIHQHPELKEPRTVGTKVDPILNGEADIVDEDEDQSENEVRDADIILEAPLGVAASQKRIGLDQSVIDERLEELKRREEILAKDIAMEGWVKKAKNGQKVYMVLRPIGEIMFYKEMLMSGFGNVHLHHLKTINIRNALMARLTDKKRLRSRSSSSQASASGADADDGRFEFEILVHVHKSLGAVKSHVFQAPDHAQAVKWVQVLSCLIRMYQEQQKGSQLGPTPKNAPPPLPQTPDLPDNAIESFILPHVLGGERDDDGKPVFRRNNSEGSFLPPPSPPLPPEPPSKVKGLRKKITSKSRSSSTSTTKSTVSARGRSRSRKRSETPIIKSSSTPPPLPPWPTGKSTAKLLAKTKSSSVPPRSRAKSDPGEAAFHRNKVIWERFQNSL